MKKFDVRLGDEILITPGGLAAIGSLISITDLYDRLDKVPVKGTPNPIKKNSDIVGGMIGIIAQGKADYASINEFKEEPEYYSMMLGIKQIPSEETLRQRYDMIAPHIMTILDSANVQLLTGAGIVPSPVFRNLIPIDIDVSPFDNSGSKKEGVSWTYKKVNGFAPIFAYIGVEGYNIGAELREGSQHCQEGTPTFLEQTIDNAKKVTSDPLLVRMDSGNDSTDNIDICASAGVDFIIKRNLRKEPVDEWMEIALDGVKDGSAVMTTPREGKIVYTGTCYQNIARIKREVRIVYEVIIRSIKADGQILLEPDIEINTYWTSFYEPGLDSLSEEQQKAAVSNEEVVELYHDHGTSEQFHSEIKTDMNLERLPSGKFATNAALLLTGMIAYNILRIIGQLSLKSKDAPLKRSVVRRRIRTVIQNLITIAVRVIRHAGKITLSLGRSNAWRKTYLQVYESLSC